ncbi:MAG TPA: selenocysteine-specific translation elongation factor [Gemmatimonadales bacterium]|nr:selenocysteine-specific translation elongation factor [Gemmatimonadales bacterium]
MDPAATQVRRVVVGTAGHIDHGKTALVKALTGVDTDRWEEEKRRGITIDLGFALLPLGDGLQASVVDVPGHEGFIRNMLAGATGIDVAMLVVAADEGIMPQTEEHLAILELLGVARGVPVLTKRDLVAPEWLELVDQEVAARLGRSAVRWEPAVAVSVQPGHEDSLAALQAALRRVAVDVAERPTDDWFRLPIDRVFALPGAGTVVTGSTWSGSVAVGDSVRLLPLGRDARVRSIQVHNQAADRAVPGRRTALALVGVERTELERGHVAVTGTGWAATTALDVALDLLPAARRPVVPGTRVRVHLATAEVLARVAPGPTVSPGGQGVVRLLLESPLVARGGDRFVLRSFSPVTTIGGGAVLDPTPPAGSRLTERRLSLQQKPAERLVAWADEVGLAGLASADLAARSGVPAGRIADVLAAADALARCGEYVIAVAALQSGVARLREVLRAYHREHPLDPGMSVQALRAALAEPGAQAPPVSVQDHVLKDGEGGGVWEITGSIARLRGWRPAFDAPRAAARERLLRRLTDAGLQIPTISELEKELPGEPVQALLAHLVREGALETVDQERVAARAALEGFRGGLEAALRELGSATPAQLKERFNLTRKYLIPLLEWADRRGITRRTGDARTLTQLTARSGGS